MTAVVPKPALVPAAVRRPVVLVIVVATLVLAVLAVRFAGTSEAGGVDRRVDAVVDPVAVHTRLVDRLVAVGAPTNVVVIAALLVAVCLVARQWRVAALAVLGPGATGIATSVLKPVIGRTLDGELAFPSGHTGGATAVGLVLALLAVGLLRPRRAGWLMIVAAGALVVGGTVAAALIASKTHYATDTVGGWCTAVAVVLGGALLVDRVAGAVARPASPA